jgi:PD-(D/E)XK endonuclease
VVLDNPNREGAIAELKVATAATSLGVSVLRPMTEHGRYDLAFEVGGRLLRGSVKWATMRGDVVVVRLQSTYLTRTREVRASYGADEIDAVAAYCARLERYLLPIELVQGVRMIHLRLNAPRNGQRAALHWAADYELPGAIAQLGERSAGSRKVVGSSPTSSIPGARCETVVGAHEVRNRFGWYLERAAAGEDIRVTRRGRPYVRLAWTPPQR